MLSEVQTLLWLGNLRQFLMNTMGYSTLPTSQARGTMPENPNTVKGILFNAETIF